MRLFGKILVLLWVGLFASGVVLAQEPSSSASPPAIEPPPSLDSLLNSDDVQDLPFWRRAGLGVDGPPDLTTMDQLMLAFADGFVPNLNDEDQRKAFVAYLRTRFGDPTRPLPTRGLEELAELQVKHPEIFWPVDGQGRLVPVFPSVEVGRTEYDSDVPDGLRELVDSYLDAADAIRDITLGARSAKAFWTSRFFGEADFNALFVESGDFDTDAGGRPWSQYYADENIPIETRMMTLLEQLTTLMTIGRVRRFDDMSGEQHPGRLRPSARGAYGMRELFVGIAHAAAFLSPAVRRQLRAGDGIEVLHALRIALGRRDEFVHNFFMFPVEEAFAKLVEGIPFNSQMVIAQTDEVSHAALAKFERQVQTTSVETGTSLSVVRQMSPAEKHFRSLPGGSDCSSYNYFLRPPSFQYFTSTDVDGFSDGHITVVMGYVRFGEHVSRAAFIDKIQNVPNNQLLIRVEAVRLSLAVSGTTLVAISDVDDLDSVLSNETATTEYFSENVLRNRDHVVGEFEPDEFAIELREDHSYSNTRVGNLKVIVVPEYPLVDGESIEVARSAPPWAVTSIDLNRILEPLLELKHGGDEERLRYVKAMLDFRAASFPVDPAFDDVTSRWLDDPETSFRLKYVLLSESLLDDASKPAPDSPAGERMYSFQLAERLGRLRPEEVVEVVSNWLQTPRYRDAVKTRSAKQLIPLVAHHSRTAARLAENSLRENDLGVYLDNYVKSEFGSQAYDFVNLLIDDVEASDRTRVTARVLSLCRSHIDRGGDRGLQGAMEVMGKWIRDEVADSHRVIALLHVMLVAPQYLEYFLDSMPRSRRSGALQQLGRQLDGALRGLVDVAVAGTAVDHLDEARFSNRFYDWLTNSENIMRVRRMALAYWLVQVEDKGHNFRPRLNIFAGLRQASPEEQLEHLRWMHSEPCWPYVARLPSGIFEEDGIARATIGAYMDEVRAADPELFTRLLRPAVITLGQRFVSEGIIIVYYPILKDIEVEGLSADFSRLYKYMIDTPIPESRSMHTGMIPLAVWFADTTITDESVGQVALSIMSGDNSNYASLALALSKCDSERKQHILRLAFERRAAAIVVDSESREIQGPVIRANFWSDVAESWETRNDRGYDLAVAFLETLSAEELNDDARAIVFYELIMDRHFDAFALQIWSVFTSEQRHALVADYVLVEGYDWGFKALLQLANVFDEIDVGLINEEKERRAAAGLDVNQEFLRTRVAELEAKVAEVSSDQTRDAKLGEAVVVLTTLQAELAVRYDVPDALRVAAQLETLLKGAVSTPVGLHALGLLETSVHDLPPVINDAIKGLAAGRKMSNQQVKFPVQDRPAVGKATGLSRPTIVQALDRVMAVVPRSSRVHRVWLAESIRSLVL